jgi:hypothetical protein
MYSLSFVFDFIENGYQKSHCAGIKPLHMYSIGYLKAQQGVNAELIYIKIISVLLCWMA